MNFDKKKATIIVLGFAGLFIWGLIGSHLSQGDDQRLGYPLDAWGAREVYSNEQIISEEVPDNPDAFDEWIYSYYVEEIIQQAPPDTQISGGSNDGPR